MYHDVFVKLGLSEYQLRPIKTPLADFICDTVGIKGSITLPIELGVEPIVKRVIMKFVVVKLTCAHSIILGQLGLAGITA